MAVFSSVWRADRCQVQAFPHVPYSAEIALKKAVRIRILLSLGIWMCPSPLEPMIAPCIVAKCGHFRAREWRHNGKWGLKWPISEIGVPFLAEILSYGPEKQAIGGDFGLRWAQPIRGGASWGVVGDVAGIWHGLEIADRF